MKDVVLKRLRGEEKVESTNQHSRPTWRTPRGVCISRKGHAGFAQVAGRCHLAERRSRPASLRRKVLWTNDREPLSGKFLQAAGYDGDSPNSSATNLDRWWKNLRAPVLAKLIGEYADLFRNPWRI